MQFIIFIIMILSKIKFLHNFVGIHKSRIWGNVRHLIDKTDCKAILVRNSDTQEMSKTWLFYTSVFLNKGGTE